MKALIVSLFAMIPIGAGVHVGDVGVGIHDGGGHRHCVS